MFQFFFIVAFFKCDLKHLRLLTVVVAQLMKSFSDVKVHCKFSMHERTQSEKWERSLAGICQEACVYCVFFSISIASEKYSTSKSLSLFDGLFLFPYFLSSTRAFRFTEFM